MIFISPEDTVWMESKTMYAWKDLTCNFLNLKDTIDTKTCLEVKFKLSL